MYIPIFIDNNFLMDKLTLICTLRNMLYLKPGGRVMLSELFVELVGQEALFMSSISFCIVGHTCSMCMGHSFIINARHMRTRVTVLAVCMCIWGMHSLLF